MLRKGLSMLVVLSMVMAMIVPVVNANGEAVGNTVVQDLKTHLP